MGLEITQLLDTRTWRAFDVDEQGRVLAGSDETGTVQLVELTDGGRQVLTALPEGCKGRYLPGERAVVVQHDAGGNERGQLSLLRLDVLDRPAGPDDLVTLVHDPEYVHSIAGVLPGRIVYLTNRRNRVDFDVVIRNVLTGEEETVYADGGWVSDAAVSPLSRYVAALRPGNTPMAGQLLLVDTMPATEDERVRALTPPELPAQHAHLHWTPDGESLVVTTDRDRDLSAIARYTPSADEWHWLVTSEEHDLRGWLSPDGSMLLVMANDDGVARLALHDGTTGALLHEVRTPTDGWMRFPLPEPVWSQDSRYLALSFSGPTVPGDVLLVDAASGVVRTLTDSSAQLDGSQLCIPRTHRVPTPDGESIPCFSYSGDAPDGSAVLVLHGGPAGQSVRRFDPIVQSLAAAGHTVIVPNIRGSAGYGKRWYSADDTTLRMASIADLAALHAWLPSLGVDQRRAALWGASYGGYLVLAGVAFQPELWAAGVDIVGISSLVTFLENTASYRRAHREMEYGSLTDDRDFLVAASPLTAIADVRAPLFVIHGANDPRVPVSEAEQISAALGERGIECELAVYADEGHGLAKRANRLDAYPRAMAFLARHLAKAE